MDSLLTKDDKAIAINLAMNIDLGIVSLNAVLDEIKKDPKEWLPILEFWGESCELTRLALYRLFFKKCRNNPARKGVC